MDERAKGTTAKPWSCTEDCKRQVVDLVAGTGRAAASVAAEVGLRHTLLPRWVKRHGQPDGAAAAALARPAPASSLKPLPVPTAGQAAEPDAEHLSGPDAPHLSGIARLRRGNERLRMERGIFRKGIAILAVALR